MKNNMHYSKQNTADATRVTAAFVSLGQQTSHSLQSLCFVPCNAIFYFIATLLRICLDVIVEQVETVIFYPTFRVSTRSTDIENQIFKRWCFSGRIRATGHEKKFHHFPRRIFSLIDFLIDFAEQITRLLTFTSA